MAPKFPSNPFAPAISFWCSLWQAQLERNLQFWGAWAQFVPQGSAAELAAEAERMKPVVRTARPGTATRRSAPKPAKAPAEAPATAAKAARAPRTTPAKAGPAEPAFPVVH